MVSVILMAVIAYLLLFLLINDDNKQINMGFEESLMLDAVDDAGKTLALISRKDHKDLSASSALDHNQNQNI